MRRTRKLKFYGGGGSWLFFLIASVFLGYFSYGNTLTAAFLGGLLYFVVPLGAIVGLIPIAGPFIYGFVVFPMIDSWAHSLAGVPAAWFDTWIFWGGMIVAVILTIVTTAILLIWIRK